MSAEQIKRLADDLATAHSTHWQRVRDGLSEYDLEQSCEASNKARAELHAAIDAALPGVRALTDEQIHEILDQAHREATAQGITNGGMVGETWNLIAARAIERAHTAEPPINAAPLAEQNRQPTTMGNVRLAPDAGNRHDRAGNYLCQKSLAAARARLAERASPQAVPAEPRRDDMHLALLAIITAAGKAKEPCGDDPESPAAIRNGAFATIASIASQGLGWVRGPSLAPQAVDAPVAPSDEQINEVIRAQQFWTVLARESGFALNAELHEFARALYALKAPAKEGNADV
jgi:hypothetical protein